MRLSEKKEIKHGLLFFILFERTGETEMTNNKVPVTVEHVVKGMLKAVQHGIIRDDDIILSTLLALRWDDNKKETASAVFLIGTKDGTPRGRLYISADEYTWKPIESEENSNGKQKDQ